jgi:hypothetical protein
MGGEGNTNSSLRKRNEYEKEIALRFINNIGKSMSREFEKNVKIYKLKLWISKELPIVKK